MMVEIMHMLALIFGILCFSRMLLQYGRLHIDHPLAQFTMRMTQWMVKPLRRILPPLGRFDMASVASALIFIYVMHLVVALWLFRDVMVLGNVVFLAGSVLSTVLTALKAATYSLLIGLLIQTILSWQQQPTHLLTVMQRIYRPLTKPFAWMRYRQFDFSAAILVLFLWWWLSAVLPYLQQSLNAWYLQ